ncbi:MAG: 4'-phosphopantetheinyl transferase superfamily protein [Alteromonadaceae bacterium]|nr:4'-phosphopantetheinyl transferase superfamily protein [Alteromonadaceae bacterium]
MPHSLSENNVHVWCITPDHVTSLQVKPSAYHSVLSAHEIERADQMLIPKQKHIFISAKMLVRHVLSLYCLRSPETLTFTHNQYGKPFLLDVKGEISPLRFNLSHTRDSIALSVVKNSEIGIDIEANHRDLHRDIEEISKRFFTSIEQEYLANSSLPQQEFLRLWTLKESYIKCLGRGLSIPLNSIEFFLNADQNPNLLGTILHPETGQQMCFFQGTLDCGNSLSFCVTSDQKKALNMSYFLMERGWKHRNFDFSASAVSARLNNI